jgi:sugar lactone lactonase YvrE
MTGATVTDIRRVGSQTDILGESPVWDAKQQALYWEDCVWCAEYGDWKVTRFAPDRRRLRCYGRWNVEQGPLCRATTRVVGASAATAPRA